MSEGRTEWLLECRDLAVRRGRRMILQDVNLSLRQGECLSLIGPNGSGKTTLMLALLGMLPPARGSVCVGGRELHRLPARQRGRLASYVPQTVDRLPAFRVVDVVAGGRFPYLAPLRPPTAADAAIVQEALASCGLAALADRPIDEISGGERQKTLIAAAIAQQARIMFLDEPNTALDPAYQVELAGLLQRWRAGGGTIVLISHDLQLPAVLGGRVAALRGGRVVGDAPAPEVLVPERLMEIYGTRFERVATADGRRFVLPHWP